MMERGSDTLGILAAGDLITVVRQVRDGLVSFEQGASIAHNLVELMIQDNGGGTSAESTDPKE
jgi:hypothetical protein